MVVIATVYILGALYSVLPQAISKTVFIITDESTLLLALDNLSLLSVLQI